MRGPRNQDLKVAAVELVGSNAKLSVVSGQLEQERRKAAASSEKLWAGAERVLLLSTELPLEAIEQP